MGLMKRLAEQGRAARRGTFTQKDLEGYEREWADFMVEIWREKMEKLQVNDTGTLRASLQELVTTGEVTTIEHKFMQYGLYVAAGVGNGFYHGNPGDLLFMGDKYRRDNSDRYGSRQVGAGLSEKHMLGPKYGEVTVKRGKNAGKRAALTSGERRRPKDWFFKKYYYSLRRLNLTEAMFFGRAYQGMMSSFLDELFGGGIRSNRF